MRLILRNLLQKVFLTNYEKSGKNLLRANENLAIDSALLSGYLGKSGHLRSIFSHLPILRDSGNCGG